MDGDFLRHCRSRASAGRDSRLSELHTTKYFYLDMKIDPNINKRPVKTGGYSSARLHAKRDRKRREAESRADAHGKQWEKFSLDDRVACLYRKKPGQNTREIVRLQKRICAVELNIVCFPKVQVARA